MSSSPDKAQTAGAGVSDLAAAACHFKVSFSGSAQDLVDRARQKVQGAGGTFDGDAGSGSFSVPTPLGHVQGDYQISGQALTVNITKKPFLIPCSAIESYVKSRLG